MEWKRNSQLNAVGKLRIAKGSPSHRVEPSDVNNAKNTNVALMQERSENRMGESRMRRRKLTAKRKRTVEDKAVKKGNTIVNINL